MCSEAKNPGTPSVTIVIASLAMGGAERMALTLAEGLVQRGHGVSLITFSGEQNDFYQLPAQVKRLVLNIAGKPSTLFKGLWRNAQRVRALRSALTELRPDAVISFMPETNVTALVAAAGTGIPVIVTEHVNPVSSPLQRLWALARRVTYPFSAKLVSVSAGVDAEFNWLPENKRGVAAPPLSEAVLLAAMAPAPDKSGTRLFAAMGRLTYQKGFDILLRSFAKISTSHPGWRLLVISDGPMRGQLEALSMSLGLKEKVIFTGALPDPFSVMRQAEFFVMPSRFEGFGYVLVEALACGLAVAAADCPSGPAEILENGKYGLLFPPENEDALAAVLERLMDDEPERLRLAALAPQAVRRFMPETVLDNWEDFLRNV